MGEWEWVCIKGPSFSSLFHMPALLHLHHYSFLPCVCACTFVHLPPSILLLLPLSSLSLSLSHAFLTDMHTVEELHTCTFSLISPLFSLSLSPEHSHASEHIFLLPHFYCALPVSSFLLFPLISASIHSSVFLSCLLPVTLCG